MTDEKIPLLVICGPTASGKTDIGARLAEIYGGEVVSADSMQIYKGLAICTAKPSPDEMRGIPHHMMDFLETDMDFSVADYVRRAGECIRDIRGRGKLPVLVGGTGLYINSLIDNVSFDHIPSDDSLRKGLEKEAAEMGREHMHEKLRRLDPGAAERIHPNNLIRVIRAIEMKELSGRTAAENRIESRRNDPPYKLCMIGLTCFDRQLLYERINKRVDKMLENGLVEEVRRVYENDQPKTAFNAIGYKEVIPYLKGERTLEQTADIIKQETRRYAKRQLTWFRRDVRINWIDTAECEHIDQIINNCMNIVAKSEIM